jgi:excisionase family DNA binding protein
VSGRVAHLSPAGEVYITRQECAERLGIGVSTLDRWVKEKGLPSHRWGMRIRRFRMSEVERWLREVERERGKVAA